MDAVKVVKCVEGNYEAEDILVEGCIYQVWKEDRDYYYVNPVNPAAGWDKDRFEEFHFNVEATPKAPKEALEIYRKATEKPTKAKDTQVAGNHYTKCGIQPYEYTLANGLGGLEHTIIKYVTRWKDKGGVEDLKKARHTLDYLIEYVEKL